MSAEEAVDPRALRRDLLLAFEYSHHEEDWVFPLARALDGLTAAEAAWTPPGGADDARSVWRIVLHVTVWTENIVARMAQRQRGEPPGRPAEGPWPDLPALRDDAAWVEAKDRLWASVAALRGHIEQTPPAAMLDQGSAGYSQLADLLCRLVHTAYHVGQITKLRDWMAAESGGGKAP